MNDELECFYNELCQAIQDYANKHALRVWAESFSADVKLPYGVYEYEQKSHKELDKLLRKVRKAKDESQ